MQATTRATPRSPRLVCVSSHGLVQQLLGIVLAVANLAMGVAYGLLNRPFVPIPVCASVVTIAAVTCLFRAARGYQHECGLLLSSSVSVRWWVVSWVFCGLAAVLVIADVVVSYDIYEDAYYYFYYYTNEDGFYAIGSSSFSSAFVALVCMLIYAEKSRKAARRERLGQQQATATVNDVPLSADTVIAQEVHSVFAHEVEVGNGRAAAPPAPVAAIYDLPRHKDQCRSILAPAPRAVVIGVPLTAGDTSDDRLEQQQPGQAHRKIAIDP